MTEKQQILNTLKQLVDDEERIDSLIRLCNEIIDEYNESSAEGVAVLLQSRINKIRTKFDESHAKLLNKMGL